MPRVNNTMTFAEVHQRISNFFISNYSATEDEQGIIGGVNNEKEQYNKWKRTMVERMYKKKRQRQLKLATQHNSFRHRNLAHHHSHHNHKWEGSTMLVW
eukprot:1779508-Amphidinium_carterae.6